MRVWEARPSAGRRSRQYTPAFPSLTERAPGSLDSELAETTVAATYAATHPPQKANGRAERLPALSLSRSTPALEGALVTSEVSNASANGSVVRPSPYLEGEAALQKRNRKLQHKLARATEQLKQLTDERKAHELALRREAQAEIDRAYAECRTRLLAANTAEGQLEQVGRTLK